MNDLNINQVIVQLISFSILFFLLKFFIWNKVQIILKERREKIKKDLENIDSVKKEIEILKKEYNDKINHIDEISKLRIEEAVKKGKDLAENIIASSNLEAEKMIKKAKQDIMLEINKNKEEMKNSIVELSFSITKKILEKEIDEKKNKKIIEDFLKELEKC